MKENISSLWVKSQLNKLTNIAYQYNQLNGIDYAVIADGYLSNVMILGEAMGATEEKEKRIFVGRSGKILRKALNENDINRFLMVNAVPYRPSNNDTPNISLISRYSFVVYEIIKTLNISFIFVAGRVAARSIDECKKYIDFKNIVIIYSYHPAYLLYNNKPETIDRFISDIRRFRQAIDNNLIVYDEICTIYSRTKS